MVKYKKKKSVPCIQVNTDCRLHDFVLLFSFCGVAVSLALLQSVTTQCEGRITEEPKALYMFIFCGKIWEEYENSEKLLKHSVLVRT
jgi:hypothetical protein